MDTVASAAGTAHQWASASTTRPHTSAAGATTTMTDMALSIRSTDMARRPERVRTSSTSDVISRTATTDTIAALRAVGVA